ncbi:interferon-induced 35 kDa protein isoform X2 [Xenopus laevis]|nr:interferon-induced 35 kDa protein isoform X2 [Xenopus laevis]
MEGEASFVHVPDTENILMDSNEDHLRTEIKKMKDQCTSLNHDADKYEKEKNDSLAFAKKLQDKVDKLQRSITEEEAHFKDKDDSYEKNIKAIWEENQGLKKQKEELEQTIDKVKENIEKLEKVSSAGTERKMVFKGKSLNKIPENGLVVKHRIVYPVRGGTALITFEKPEDASNIIQKERIEVTIEECRVFVQAKPVELMLLDSLNVDMSLSRKKILISNLPPSLSEDILLDKLEIFFCKSKNDGGEVENREFLPDSRNVILTFCNEKVVPQLLEKKKFKVHFGNSTQEVHVTPSLDGDIKQFQMKYVECNRTVLITGIPDIKDTDDLRDLLEIYFQKPSNGGGEVEALIYCPEGQQALAIFEDDNEE